jgi:phosphate transport system substrate-binding protein
MKNDKLSLRRSRGRTRTFLIGGGAAVVAALAFAAACKRQTPAPAQAPGQAEPAPSGAAAAITVKGSDTMVLLGQRWAEEYMKVHPNAQVQVTGGGSGTGISALQNGTTDIAESSRPMKDKEKKSMRERTGAEVKEVPVAKDGVSVYVNAANPVASLTLEQVKGIYTGKITDWKDVGGKPGKIIVYSRENNSGTYEFFKEHVLGGADFAATAQTMPGTGGVVNAIEKDARGIGYGGLAYAKDIKLVAIAKDKDTPPVAPSQATVLDGSYPLSRPLFFYARADVGKHVTDFIDFVLSDAGQAVVAKVGYFPIKEGAPAAGAKAENN